MRRRLKAGTGETPYYSTYNAMWPDLVAGHVDLTTPRAGMDRRTGLLLTGWPHVEQSMRVILSTPFHTRVLRRWCGSFVPHILGKTLVQRIITRFWWAIACAIDLWEPGYAIKRVHFMGDALYKEWSPLSDSATADIIRTGEVIFRQDGVFYPRGHLGDYTPYESRGYSLNLQRTGVGT